MVCSDNIHYIINFYRYVYIVSCIVTEKPHQGSINKVLYCSWALPLNKVSVTG